MKQLGFIDKLFTDCYAVAEVNKEFNELKVAHDANVELLEATKDLVKNENKRKEELQDTNFSLKAKLIKFENDFDEAKQIISNLEKTIEDMKLEYDELKKKSIEQNMRIIELSKEKQDLEESIVHSKNENAPTRAEPIQEIVIAEDSKIVMVPKFISFKLSEQEVVKLIDSCLEHYSKDKKQIASMLKAKEQYTNGGKLFDYAVTVFKIALTRRRKDMKYWFENYDDIVNKNKIVVTTNKAIIPGHTSISFISTLTNESLDNLICDCLSVYKNDSRKSIPMLNAKKKFEDGSYTKLVYADSLFKTALSRKRKGMSLWFNLYDTFVNKVKSEVGA